MRVLQTLLSAVLITTCSTHSIEKRESGEKRVVCYYTNWSVYRPGTAKYNPQNINPYLCTHLIYAFGGLDRENGLRPYDKYQDIEQGGYAKFTGLKSYNKNLKTMLAIGGWNEGSARFSPLVADEERRQEFVKNVVKFLRVNHFDGLDLDWEYPAFRDGGKPRDRDNYAQLVQELREEFDREHEKTGRPRLLLTMAVPAGIEYIDKGYDVPKLNKYLDFMNILSYDYHSAFEPAVNHHSPLHPLEEESEYNFDAQLSIDYTIKHYLKSGADRDKLVLGIPTYGRSYTLFNTESTDIGSPADGPGEQGDATREKGYLAYYEICGALNSQDDWTVVQPKPGAMGPYAYRNNQWVGYDDIDIVKEKANYVNDQSLGGIMFWSIDNDDFRGKCHDRPYPLIEAAKEALFASSASNNNLVSSSNKREKSASPLSRPEKPSSLFTNRRNNKPAKPKPRVTTTTAAPAASRDSAGGLTTPEPPTTPDPGSDFVCKDEGFFPHPRDCKKYFWCLDSGPSNLGIVAHQFTCPSGLFFNKAADSCDYTRNVLCNKKEKATTAAPKVTQAATSKSTAGRAATTTTSRPTTTTTTTTEAPEEEYEEEEEEHEQEDPEAIKQLIQLIKKLGGVAELEKQLEGAGSPGASTPSIPRSLYNKVLTPQRPRYQSPYRNGPSGPQNEGLSNTDDGAPYRRDKPQYVNIRRERPTTEAAPEEDVVIVEPEKPSRVKYTSIQRSRPSGQYEVTEPDEEEEVSHRPLATSPRYQTIERSRPSRPPSRDQEDEPEDVDRFRPKYSTIQRSRSTTTVEPFVENTTPRYVTLRRQRPQNEQQQEESTIKHTGETVVVETEEEIKPIEIDVEEPITTSVRPRTKVSERPTTTENLYIVTAETAKPTTSEPSTTTTELPAVFTLTTESSTEVETVTPDMSSSSQPTTVPYQTSTLTSIVTVIVEGATERRRVPLTKLKQALADHDLLSNSVSTDKKALAGKSSVLEPAKEEEKPEEKGIYRPIGNYRGRPRKPIVVEQPTTKALPLYLQRRRTTTETSLVETKSTEEPSKVKTIGRFSPSRLRDKSRDRTSTEVTVEGDSSTLRPNRFRTSRPAVGGSRFISRGRTRSTTASPSDDETLIRKSGGNNETESEPTVDTGSKRRKFGDSRRKTSTEAPTETGSEKPTRLFSRGRVRTTTTEKVTNSPLNTTTSKPPNRSRFVLNRNKNRTSDESLQRTRLAPVTLENNRSAKNSSSPSSRYQIQRRRKFGNTAESNVTKDISSDNVTDITRHKTSEEEHEMMISQENSSLKPNQLVGKETNNFTLIPSDNSTITATSVNNDTQSVNIENLNATQSTFTELDSVSSDTEIFDEVSLAEGNKNSSISNLELGGFLNNTQENSTDLPLTSSAPADTVSDDTPDNVHSESDPSDGEVLNVIASKYSEQSYTGRRGSVRFGESQDAEVPQRTRNSILVDSKRTNNLVQTRRRKINPESPGKVSLAVKANEDTDTSSKRRKVLVRKLKVPEAAENPADIVNQSRERNLASRGRSASRFRVDESNNQAESYQLSNSQSFVQDSRTKSSRRNNVDLNSFTNNDFRKINALGDNQGSEHLARRKVKVLKSRNQVSDAEVNSDTNGNKRRVVLRKRTKVENEDSTNMEHSALRRGSSRFQPKDLTDLDTGTSLYVQRETESDDASRGSFIRSVQDLGNSLINDLSSRGTIKAKDSLLDDIEGVLGEEEDSTDYPTDDDQAEVGANRAKVSFRRPLNSDRSRSRTSTTTEATVNTERPSSNKFFRRRVTKYKPEPRNTTTSSTTEDVFETTVKPRRFEFPRRTVRPNLNSLPQQAALVATSSPFVQFDDNHSDESLHEVDTERIESQGVYRGIEDATLPDLANVAVAAIQSLATVPPSTETFAPVTASTLRRQQTTRFISITTPPPTTVRPAVRRGTPRPFAKISPTAAPVAPKSQYLTRNKPYDDLAPDYEDYYAEPVDVPLSGKVRIHNDGYIECLDIGNFPHPFACKKFISCAKMENGHLLGWEYTCPRGLSFDPIGGICNWSAGLGCKE